MAKQENRPVVQGTKKMSWKPLNQMNGDRLQSLKKPISSEMKQQVRGQNIALKLHMKKTLNLFYKDQLYVVGKMQRGQHSVYGTMLRVHADRKRIERETRLKQKLEKEKIAQESFAQRVDDWMMSDGNNTDTKNVPMDTSEETKPTQPSIQENDTRPDLNEEAVNTASKIKHKPKKKHPKTEHVEQQYSAPREGVLASSTPVPEHAPDETNSRDNLIIPQSGDSDKNIKSLPTKTLMVNRLNLNYPVVAVRERKSKQPELHSIDENSVIEKEGLSTHQVKLDFCNDEDKIHQKQNWQPSMAGVYINTSTKSKTEQSLTMEDPNGVQEMQPPIKSKKRQMKKQKVIGNSIDQANTYTPFALSPEVLSPLRTRRRGVVQPPPAKYLLDNQRLNEIDDVIHLVSEANNVCNDEKTKENRRSRNELNLSSYYHQPITDESNSQSSGKAAISLVELNKIYEKRKQRKLKKELSRPFTEYRRNSLGDIVPALVPSKRKEFRVPSGSEVRKQQKLLDEEKNSVGNRNQQIKDFYIKLENDEEQRRRVKTPKNDKPVEIVERSEKLQESGGFTSKYLFAAFKQAPLPEGLDPNSEQALLLCNYVRNYKPKTRRRQNRESVPSDRISSWNPVGFVATVDI